MEHFSDWLSLALRWIHVIAGAAWIGTSFYFNWLNNHVRPPEKPEEGVAGELWSVHGGHFYRVVKYAVAPEKLPKILHWFKWEAYLTWISGFSLLCVVYYLNADTYMVDASVTYISPIAAATGLSYAAVTVIFGLLTLALGWTVYHFLCKSPLAKQPVVLAALGFVLLVGVAFWLTQTFGSRAAYIHVGALLGTMMAANVFFVIIPNQRVMVDAMVNGEELTDAHAKMGLEGALRSRHNNYFTLPVLFIMVSNHYPVTYGHEWNWAILAGLSIVGAGVRHWFNLRGMGEKNVWILPAAAVAMVALALVTVPKTLADHRPVTFEEVREIFDNRCITCHSGTPTHEAFATAPQGIQFDTPQQMQSMATRINSVVVVARTMPLGNMTGMTDEERDIVGAWIYQGADVAVDRGAAAAGTETETETDPETDTDTETDPETETDPDTETESDTDLETP